MSGPSPTELFLITAPSFGLLERVLAVVGGAVVAGFGIAWLVQLLVKLASAQQLPRWAVHLLRILGAIVGGLIVYFAVFGTGGGGWGWGGGAGDGQGPGKDGGEPMPTARAKPDTSRTPPREDVLLIDVLGKKAVRNQLGDKAVEDKRYFRIQGSDELLSPDDLKKAIEQRRGRQPRLDTLEFRMRDDDSSDWTSGLLEELKTWGRSNKFKVRPYEA